MLGKAKIKSKCKGDDTSNILILDVKKIRRVLANSIPVLSIFALVGMVINAVILLNSSSTAEAVYAAEEVIGDSTASITISGAGSNEQVEAGYGEVSYRAHTVRLQASNAKTHTLIISGPSTLVTKNKDGSIVSGATPTTINSASGVTGATMASDSSKSNIWGYGWGDTSTSDEDLVYAAPSAIGTALAAGSIDNATHNLDVTKKLAFAIKFSEDALPGRYTDTVTLQLVVTPRTLTTYSITYNANGGDDAPTTQSIESYEDSYSFTIPNAIPTRSGYNFLGWSTSSNASTADSNYAIGKTVTLTVSNPSRVLYAVWELAFNDFPASLTTMQGMTADICKAADVGATKTLTDTRDNNTYTVAKLADGNCWMTQNLRIINKTISSSDSDVSSNFVIPASSTTAFSSAYDVKNAYYRDTIYGAYYNWYTATAGTGTRSLQNADAPSSICPKGWKLPKGGANGDFAALYIKYPNTNPSAFDTEILGGSSKNGYWIGAESTQNGGSFFLTSGYYYSGTNVLEPQTKGFYWSRTAASLTTDPYDFYIYAQRINVDHTFNSRYGFSVRCVAYQDNYTYSISYKFKDGHSLHSGTMPSDEVVTTSSTSHTFTVKDGPMVQTGASTWCSLRNWLGSDGVVYTPDSTVTLTPDKPSITLTTNTTGTCAGGGIL